MALMNLFAGQQWRRRLENRIVDMEREGGRGQKERVA